MAQCLPPKVKNGRTPHYCFRQGTARPGFVKTRLAIGIGDEAACKVYRQLTETVLAKLASLPNVEIRFTPDDARDEIKSWLRKDWGAKPQREGDLGQRMHRAFK